MLFSYALLFAVLTTFVAAAPFHSPESTMSEHSPEPGPELLPIDGKALLDATRYLTYGTTHACAPGWTRLPSTHPSENTMGLSFQDSLSDGLLVYVRRISTGDGPGNVPAGLDEVHQIAPQADYVLKDVTSLEKEIIGSWWQRLTDQKMEITYNSDKKQFDIRPVTRDDYSGEKEMLFTRPVGRVPLQLVEPHSETTASYSLVVAGGEWVPRGSLAHDPISITFDIWRLGHQDTLMVQQHFKDRVEKWMPVHQIKNHQILTGIWHRKSRVSPTKQGDGLKIEYVEDEGFYMQFLE